MKCCAEPYPFLLQGKQRLYNLPDQAQRRCTHDLMGYAILLRERTTVEMLVHSSLFRKASNLASSLSL